MHFDRLKRRELITLLGSTAAWPSAARAQSPPTFPVEQPTKFDLVVNLTTARALKLAVPEAFYYAPTR